jgi:predicted transcriptional regulator of viral defense system
MNEMPEDYEVQRFLPTNPYNFNTHRWRVWEHLSKHGSLTTHEIHSVLHVDPTRVNEVSHELPKGYVMPDSTRIEEGNYLYRVIRMEDRP